MITEGDIKYADERWPGAEMGSVRYGYLEGVRMEREACAKIADDAAAGWDEQHGRSVAYGIRDAIRARSA